MADNYTFTHAQLKIHITINRAVWLTGRLGFWSAAQQVNINIVLDKSIHTFKLRKRCLTWSSLHAPALLFANVQSFKSTWCLPFEFTAAPSVILPALQRQKVPALPVLLPLVWASAGTFTRQVSAGALLPELLQGWQRGTQQSREAIKKGVFFLQGAGCQISSPTVGSLTLNKQFF